MFAVFNFRKKFKTPNPLRGEKGNNLCSFGLRHQQFFSHKHGFLRRRRCIFLPFFRKGGKLSSQFCKSCLKPSFRPLSHPLYFFPHPVRPISYELSALFLINANPSSQIVPLILLSSLGLGYLLSRITTAWHPSGAVKSRFTSSQSRVPSSMGPFTCRPLASWP